MRNKIDLELLHWWLCKCAKKNMVPHLLSNFLGSSTAILPTEEHCFLCHDSSGSTSPEIGRGLCGSPFFGLLIFQHNVVDFLSHTACLPLSEGE